MFLVTRVFRPTWMHILAFGIGLVFVYYRTDRRRSTTDRAYTELKMRLKELYPKPENFHMDVDIMNLYYNTKDFRIFHSEGYDESLVSTDNMLKIISEMEGGVYHCSENLQIVRDQMNKALNHYQTIVFKLPTQRSAGLNFQRRHKRALNALHVMLRRHVEFFISNGASDWDQAMASAAKAGHLHIVEYFISKCASKVELLKERLEKTAYVGEK